MLLFIRGLGNHCWPHYAFQYISCYSLSEYIQKGERYEIVSIHLMLLFILFAQRLRMAQHCFNTSHVTLYPSRLLSVQCRRVFQYISCYSLSKEGIDNMKDVRSFNTSHVTLYPSFYRLFFF